MMMKHWIQSSNILLNKMYKSFLLIVLSLFLLCNKLSAQKDSTSILKSSFSIHSPKKAAYFSTVLPGLGQVYNKKYWKVPIIYVGFAVSGYFIYDNTRGYNKFRDAYKKRLDDDPSNDNLPEYTVEGIKIMKDAYWKNRDLSYIITALIYTLNIIDATVDAHLFTFDMDKNLSLRLDPDLQFPVYSNQSFAYSQGIKLTFKF